MTLQHGNTKLGNQLWSWSLPAVSTCPGRSSLCHKLCYARRGRFNMSNVRSAYQRNRELAESEDFVSWMCAEIRRVGAQVVRIHVSGDFSDADYTDKWLQIVRRNRRVTFLAYTRSWRVPDILAVLRKMAREPHMFLWFSCDRETGAPPRCRRARRAYMATSDDDVPRFPVDLVFRDKHSTVMKYDPAGNLVCAYDQGVKRKLRMTCSRCKICWSDRRMPHATDRGCPALASGGSAADQPTGRQ